MCTMAAAPAFHRHRDVGVGEIILFKVYIVLDWWALSMHMQLT